MAAGASKLGLRSELSLRTNEWRKIRTLGGELAIGKKKPKREIRIEESCEFNHAHVQAKCKKLTKPKSKEKTQSNIHRKRVTYKDKWSKRKLFKGIKLIKLTSNEKTHL